MQWLACTLLLLLAAIAAARPQTDEPAAGADVQADEVVPAGAEAEFDESARNPVDDETKTVSTRRGYTPPLYNNPSQCGIEYDCVAHEICTPDGFIDTSGSSALDLRQGPGPADVSYRGGFSFKQTIPCTTSEGNEGLCCRLPPEEVCPNNGRCLKGWHCPNHNPNIQYRSHLEHPRSCGVDFYDQSVCCAPRQLYPPVPLTCGVRNPDGIRPNPLLPEEEYYELDKRILDYHIQNNEAKFGEFPWQALLFKQTPQGYQFLSGGVLISNRHVMTAAHHVRDLRARDMQVRLGEWEVNTKKEPIEHQDYYVTYIHIHPKYKAGPEWNDIAILTLDKDVFITNNVHTICLPTPTDSFRDKRCVATGWGKDVFEGQYQQILKKVDLPFVPYASCQAALRQTRLGKWFKLDPSFVCAGGEPDRDACTGDGGGPLICPEGGNWVLAGITSWGIGCGTEGVPGVYASVQSALPWIQQVLTQDEAYIFSRSYDLNVPAPIQHPVPYNPNPIPRSEPVEPAPEPVSPAKATVVNPAKPQVQTTQTTTTQATTTQATTTTAKPCKNEPDSEYLACLTNNLADPSICDATLCSPPK